MAVDERSFHCLYLAKIETPKRVCRPFIGGIVEMVSPWRKGKALVFPWRSYRSLALGVWFRRPAVNPEFEEDQWFSPHVLDVPIDDISTWSRGDEEEIPEPAQGGLP